MADAALIQHQAIRVEDILTPEELAIHSELLERYMNARVGTEGLDEKSATQGLDAIKRLIQTVGMPVWKMTELDINTFFGRLALDLKRAKSTRRSYQTHLKSFCCKSACNNDPPTAIIGVQN